MIIKFKTLRLSQKEEEVEIEVWSIFNGIKQSKKFSNTVSKIYFSDSDI